MNRDGIPNATGDEWEWEWSGKTPRYVWETYKKIASSTELNIEYRDTTTDMPWTRGAGLYSPETDIPDRLCYRMRRRVEGKMNEANDPVTRPAGYTQGDIECIDAERSALTPEEFRGACKAQALQYIWRERHKGGDEDLRKAVWWLRMAVGDDPREARGLRDTW